MSNECKLPVGRHLEPALPGADPAVFPQKQFWLWIILAAVAVFLYPWLLYCVTWFIAFTTGQDLALPKSLAEIGDAYGSANAIVSALAFVALVWTLLLQRRDIETQQKMLEQSINEMNKTAEGTKQLAESQHIANQLAALQLERDLICQIGELEKEVDSRNFNDDARHYVQLFRLKQRHSFVSQQLAELGIIHQEQMRKPSRLFEIANELALHWSQGFDTTPICEKAIEELRSFPSNHRVSSDNRNDARSICRTVSRMLDEPND